MVYKIFVSPTIFIIFVFFVYFLFLFFFTGSYKQDIVYMASKEQVHELVERSYSCSQYVSLKCRGSRFLNYNGEPFGWWVGRTHQPMYYWGGSEVGIRKCRCGVNQECDYANQFCNCDAADVTKEVQDDGLLTNKVYLPIYKINLGDTGEINENRYQKYTIGNLICEGDRLYDNIVTFRKPDAVLQVGFFDIFWTFACYVCLIIYS